MDDKKFMTYEEQLTFLEKEKGLIINDKNTALALLKKYSYFALVNGYKHPFKNRMGTYKTNTSIQDILYLYQFDNKLRYLFIKNIMDVELHIKSLLSYIFSKKFGESESAYLLATNYNYVDRTYQEDINRLIQILTEIKNDYKSYPYMKHQKEQHGNVPLWVMVKALTLGNISKMYSCQKPEIQTKISKEFYGVSEDDLRAFLDLLTRFRNVCAHNERLFDYRYNKRGINNMEIHYELSLPQKNNQFKKGKSDLFAVVISLKYLLGKEDFIVFADEMKDCINDLTNKTAQIKRDQLYKYMGFPSNWELLKEIEIHKDL